MVMKHFKLLILHLFAITSVFASAEKTPEFTDPLPKTHFDGTLIEIPTVTIDETVAALRACSSFVRQLPPQFFSTPESRKQLVIGERKRDEASFKRISKRLGRAKAALLHAGTSKDNPILANLLTIMLTESASKPIEGFGETDFPLYNYDYRIIEAVLKDRKSPSILSIGSGFSRLLPSLSMLDVHCRGIDQDPSMVKYFNDQVQEMKTAFDAKLDLEAQVADARDNYLEGEMFDVIEITRVLYFMSEDDQVQTLKNALNHLSDGGTLHIWTTSPFMGNTYLSSKIPGFDPNKAVFLYNKNCEKSVLYHVQNGQYTDLMNHDFASGGLGIYASALNIHCEFHTIEQLRHLIAQAGVDVANYEIYYLNKKKDFRQDELLHIFMLQEAKNIQQSKNN